MFTDLEVAEVEHELDDMAMACIDNSGDLTLRDEIYACGCSLLVVAMQTRSDVQVCGSMDMSGFWG